MTYKNCKSQINSAVRKIKSFYICILFLTLLFKQGHAQLFDYTIGNAYGAHYVEQGHKIWARICADTLPGQGYGGNYLLGVILTASNLPPGCKSSWPDLSNTVLANGNNYALSIPFGMDPVHHWDPHFPAAKLGGEAIALEIQTSNLTPVGTYTITIAGKSMRKDSIVHQTKYTITVEPHSSLPVPKPFCSRKPLPDSLLWVSTMKQVGKSGCDACAPYYDGEYVYFQIADYLKDTSFYACARNAQYNYRDDPSPNVASVLPQNGKLKGYEIFPNGLYEGYKRWGDTLDRRAVIELGTNGNYSGGSGPPYSRTSVCDPLLTREIAYNMRTFILEKNLGIDRRAQLDDYMEGELQQYDEYFRSKNDSLLEPFIVGVAAESLIMYYDSIKPDPRIFRYIKLAMDSLWNRMWVESAPYNTLKATVADSSFRYADINYNAYGVSGDTASVPNLNMLIGPAFGWLYHMTGDTTYLVRGDKIFASGALYSAYDHNSPCVGWSQKIFNQNYRWGIKYVKWRDMDLVVNCVNSIQEEKTGLKFKMYPNPTNHELTISYELSGSQNVLIELFDVKGEKVKTLYNQKDMSGSHDFKTNISDVAKGFYIINMNGKREKLIIQ